MRLVVVAALTEELTPLARRLGAGRPLPIGRRHEGRIGAVELTLLATGDGAERARDATSALLREVKPAALVGVGCAGGATPELRAGDLLVAERVVDGESGEVLAAPASPWLERARALDGVLEGTVVTTPRIARGPRAKARAAEYAPTGSAVVDLESWTWATEARAAGVPFVFVRGVTDPLDERLPLDFERCRGADGSVDRRRVLRAASVRPHTWPALFGLRRRLRAVAVRLGESVPRVAAP